MSEIQADLADRLENAIREALEDLAAAERALAALLLIVRQYRDREAAEPS